MTDCVFCKIINGDLPSYKIKETNDVIVFLGLEGHPLIVPKQHIKDIYDLDPHSASSIMQEAVIVSRALKEAINCDGINLVQSNGKHAGQDVFHFHLHIKPRWKDDDTILSWDTSSKSAEEQESLRVSLVKSLF